MLFTFCGQDVTPETLRREKWLRMLYTTDERRVNLERVESVSALEAGNGVLSYVERTLNALNRCCGLSREQRGWVRDALRWGETAKCGSVHDRRRWRALNLPLEIHNEASAEIYRLEGGETDERTRRIVYALIFTHGMIGQYIRGEVRFEKNEPLSRLVREGVLDPETLGRVLYIYNAAIMEGVSPELWARCEGEVRRLIGRIVRDECGSVRMSVRERLFRLFPAFRSAEDVTPQEETLYGEVFAGCDLWYPEAALGDFSRREIDTVFSLLRDAGLSGVRHITFYPLSRTLMYDYAGKRRVNVYKKRAAELCLREIARGMEPRPSAQHASPAIAREGEVLSFDVRFTPVCEALAGFCVEAERSGYLTYEKNILHIFDLFGLRRDAFDRLGNEEDYLRIMNDAGQSTKESLLTFAKGPRVVDVGSGGGVLLDRMEARFPGWEITGTDISQNVIEALSRRRDREGHAWRVIRHNLVEGPLPFAADTVLFSSILHEVYSYTEWEGRRFQTASVEKALEHARISLARGGRIVIRDGVRCQTRRMGRVRFTAPDGEAFIANYLRDFRGLEDLRLPDGRWNPEYARQEGNVLAGRADLLREALYTYTWGERSYAQEVQEQFGCFTLDEYRRTLEKLGLRVLQARSFTEPGYPEHLNGKVELLDGLTWEELPSTCILVAERL